MTAPLHRFASPPEGAVLADRWSRIGGILGSGWSFVRLLVVLGGLMAFSTLAVAPRQMPITGERVALVIGNAAYERSPLLNPGNDARGMAALLQQSGFETNLLLDATTASMREATQRLAQQIDSGKVKTVLFYYAGHAVQVDWRNFLLGVDARIARLDDVPGNGLDLSDLLAAFSRHNPQRKKQFLVVLDACRDNPFRADLRLSQRGLSQFDAPPNTLVAFSTAPGQVAFDGDGTNSFYTGMLLRELAVPVVAVEDALKRVRMGVRVASLGRQIPWESTSLEENFYLFPPDRIEPRSAGDLEASIKRELQEWERAKQGNDIAALVAFMQAFPNGNFSQLAQHRLDRLLAQRAEQEAAVVAQRQREAEERAEREQAALVQAQREADAARVAEQTRRAEEARMAEAARQAEAARLAQLRREAEAAALQAEATRRAEMERLAQLARAAEERQRAQAQQAQALALAQAQREAEAQRIAQAQREAEALRVAQAQREAERAAQERQAAASTPAAPVPTLASLPLGAALLEAATRLNVAPPLPVAVLTQFPPLAPDRVAANPSFVGAEQLDRRFHVNDRWAYRIIDLFTRNQRRMPLEVTAVDENADNVVYNRGQFTSDLMGNATSTDRGGIDYPRQFYPATLQVGNKWTTAFVQTRRDGTRYTFRYDVRVAGRESIEVPAGRFQTFRIEATGFNMQLGTYIRRTIWVAPGINANIAIEIHARSRSGQVEQNDRWELVEYQSHHRAAPPAPAPASPSPPPGRVT